MEQSKPLNTHKTKESTELFACLNQAGKSVAYKSSGMANTTVYSLKALETSGFRGKIFQLASKIPVK